MKGGDVMQAVCLCVHPHCVTQVYRLDNKQYVYVLSPIGWLQTWIRLLRRLYHWDRITDQFWTAGVNARAYCQFHSISQKQKMFRHDHSVTLFRCFPCKPACEGVLQCVKLSCISPPAIEHTLVWSLQPAGNSQNCPKSLIVSDRPRLSQLQQHICCDLCWSGKRR